MDLLNSLWIAISTPNEMLITVCLGIFAVFFEVPLSLYLVKNVFNIESNNQQSITYIILTSAVFVISMFIIPTPFNTIFNLISLFLIYFFIFKLSLLKTLIVFPFPSIVFTLAGILLTHPYLAILNISHEQMISIPIYRLPLALIIYLLVFLISFCLKNKKLKITLLDEFDKHNKYIIIANFAFGLLYIIVQVILVFNYTDILPISYTFFSFVCLLIYFSLSFYTLTRIVKLITTTQKLESAEAYNKTLNILHDSVRGFKHDFDNIVTTIGGYVKTGDMKGLENYYSQLKEDCQKVNNLYILNPEIINNPGIYNLLTTKYSEAEKKGIKTSITFLLDLSTMNIKIYEFARILGILLDNAIEASEESEEKLLNLVFRNDFKNNRYIVLIENSYKNKDVDLEEIFDKEKTGKKGHTGLGLWEIKNILNKNNNMNLHTNKNETYFSQQLEIYY